MPPLRSTRRPALGATAGGSLAHGLWQAWAGTESGGSILYDARGLRHLTVTGAPVRHGLGGLTFINTATDYATSTGHQMTTFSHVAVYTVNTVAEQTISTMDEDAPPSSTEDRRLTVTSGSVFNFYFYDGGSSRNLTGTSTVQAGRTYVVAATLGPLSQKLFVDGVEEASLAVGDPFTGYTTPVLLLGTSFTSNSTGTLHAHYIYSRPLSQAEVIELSRNPFAIFPRAPKVRADVLAGGGGNRRRRMLLAA
jgi:hypothetical protein